MPHLVEIEQRLCPIGADQNAAMAIRRGELIVLPTDTVYGIAADAFSPEAVKALLDEVEGSIAVISPSRWIASIKAETRSSLATVPSGRVNIVDPMSTKGLEYDATVIVDPAAITAESPGGIRMLYVALTRAAHRMTVLEMTG